MERKIGEIFEHNGEWYQTVKSQGKCCSCDFMIDGHCIVDFSSNGSCFYCHRKDKENVIFKKLEKVGEPFKRNGYLYQEYKAHTYPLLMNGEAKLPTANGFAVKIKQNKEDMEEKNKAEGLPLLRLVGKYMNSLIDYATFEKAVKDLYSNKEESKPTLKEFDLEAAKKGKPVCTRDGRKARIICFDAKDTQPIIGLYEKNIDGIVREYLCSYHTDGRMYDDQDTGYDLMMLPEKKEGWVNVYKSLAYSTKEGAMKYRNKGNDYIDTIKISWEE